MHHVIVDVRLRRVEPEGQMARRAEVNRLIEEPLDEIIECLAQLEEADPAPSVGDGQARRFRQRTIGGFPLRDGPFLGQQPSLEKLLRVPLDEPEDLLLEPAALDIPGVETEIDRRFEMPDVGGNGDRRLAVLPILQLILLVVQLARRRGRRAGAGRDPRFNLV